MIQKRSFIKTPFFYFLYLGLKVKGKTNEGGKGELGLF